MLQDVSDIFPGVITKVCDLPGEAERIELHYWLVGNHPDLNILVNNAGIQNWMWVNDEGFFDKASQGVGINILALLQLTELFLQLKSLTTIMNVTSWLAFIPFSKVAVYSD